MIVLITMAVCGCSGLGSIVANPDEQKAYDDLKAKDDRLAFYNETFTKLYEQSQSMDMSSTSEDITLFDNAIFAADNYAKACQDSKDCSAVYRSYLDPKSSEYRHYEDYESQLSDNIAQVKNIEKEFSMAKATLKELDTWQEDANDLVGKLNEAKSLSTGDQYYIWFMTTRPTMDGYLTESDILTGMIDNVTAMPDFSGDSSELIKAKNTIITSNSELKSQYNVLADAYNNAYGSTYGWVPKI
jgi:hypothetical protein